jgi:uncharacterized damage-inducible protein DinB
MLIAIATPMVAQQQQSAPAANAAVGASKGVWQISSNYVLRAAEQVPESLYSYKPTASVRTFGQLVGHVAGAQYMFCAAAMGEAPRAEGDIENSVKDKAGLVKALKESSAYCDRAYAMTDAASAGSVTLFGMSMTKMGVLVMNAAHDYEHYGNMVTYMRIKGLTPPSSQQ